MVMGWWCLVDRRWRNQQGGEIRQITDGQGSKHMSAAEPRSPILETGCSCLVGAASGAVLAQRFEVTVSRHHGYPPSIGLGKGNSPIKATEREKSFPWVWSFVCVSKVHLVR